MDNSAFVEYTCKGELVCFIRNEFGRCGVSSIKSEPEYRQVPLSRHVPQNISRGKASTIVPGNAPGNLNKKAREKIAESGKRERKRRGKRGRFFTCVRLCTSREKRRFRRVFLLVVHTEKWVRKHAKLLGAPAALQTLGDGTVAVVL